MTNKTDYVLFVPIYNVKVYDNVVNKTIFGDYTLVKSDNIKDKYGHLLAEEDISTQQLIKDISVSHSDKFPYLPYASVVLVKEYYGIADEEKRECLIKEVDKIMLSLRLSSRGLCQINNGYILPTKSHVSLYFYTSSNIENITNFHVSNKTNKAVYEDIYILNSNVLNKAESIYNILTKTTTESARIPIDYFNNYYDVLSPQEKIIQLAIVLESSILAGVKDELQYRMFLRITALLGKNKQYLLELFYSVRSHIVHNGHLVKGKSFDVTWDKLKNFIKLKDCEDETELLFYFVKDHVEPLVRDILYKSLNIISMSKINNFDDLTKKLDKFIVKQLTTNKFELGNSKNE